jgi:hypothetical protein
MQSANFDSGFIWIALVQLPGLTFSGDSQTDLGKKDWLQLFVTSFQMDQNSFCAIEF